MRNEIRFILNDEPVAIVACDPTRTLLDWLRLERRLVGTKEGCGEGDCGACTVAVGRLSAGRVVYEPINSCIRFLPTLDGLHVVTVEHLKREGRLHPVQQAMVDHHGSQCGFCTPGIVMSLYCLALGPADPGREAIDDALAGNLCRCTGYAPIAAAAEEACRDPRPESGTADGDIAARLAGLQDDEVAAVGEGGRRFLAPATIADLKTLMAEHPDAVLVAGATDVGLWVTKEMRLLDLVIHLGRVAELSLIEEGPEAVRIGAGATLSEAKAVLDRLHPHLGELLRRFGGEQVRRAATVGGNIANGSPIGDLAPALIALDAQLMLDGPGGPRAMPIERFFLAYTRQDRRPGEFVAAVSAPRLGPSDLFHVSKVTKRFDEDISAVCGAFRLRLDATGRIAEARLAYGGMAAIPKRAAAAEAALAGRGWGMEAADAAAEALAQDFTPIDDWRASARYRLLVAGNLLRRFALEGTGGQQTRVSGPLRARIDA